MYGTSRAFAILDHLFSFLYPEALSEEFNCKSKFRAVQRARNREKVLFHRGSCPDV
jgi:hypothetical protein